MSQNSHSQVFQCQNCGEFINSSMTACSYCGVAINVESAQAAAATQAKVGQAYSDASYLKIASRSLPVFFLVSFIPIFGGLAGWAFLALLVIVPVLLVRWWVKYQKLQTADPDYENAKRNTVIAAVIWSAMIAVWLISGLIQFFLTLR